MPFQKAPSPLAQALAARGFTAPTSVQAAVLADDALGRDLLVSARTGSGKTVAFGLALADELLDDTGRCPPPGAPLALVIAPTRELALQVRSELDWLYAKTGARIVSCVGGMEPRTEARALSAGCHIVVGTPGRLCDHLKRGNLNLSGLKAVVLDEADEMLDLGFRDELETLLDAAPKTRRTLLFSATIAREIAGLARRYQHDALRVDTIGANTPHADITYRAVLADPPDMAGAVVNVLRLEEARTAIVFCHTREAVRQLQAILTERGFSSVAISGDLGQNERSRAIESLRHGQARVCVATDVAARGIDIPDLGLVIHASLPTNPATLLHRSGRTGRAGRKGTCVLLVPPVRRRMAERLLQAAKVTAEWSGAPSKQAIAQADAERLLNAPFLAVPQTGTPEGTGADATPDTAASQANDTPVAETPVIEKAVVDTAQSAPAAGTPATGMPALVQRLVASRTPEQLATALISLWQASLPEPVNVRVITPDGSRTTRGAAHDGPREREHTPRDRAAPMAGSWFRLSVGRADRADPKWLVPMLCRLGGIRKQDIGSIRIGTDHTLVEIAQDKADRFASCAAGADADEITVEPAKPPHKGAGGGGGRPPYAERKPGKPRGKGAPRSEHGGAPAKSGASSRKRKAY
ncbi:DEAD/DEAH box helicase [Acetobacter sp. TBRC 12305]|uniref:DEAD/DEAH box helicase n=1 Tax=Acetobacter garciniae TaxID=2817435 RepID=A0A939KQ14_9PROT|nr:DEAD/DEAH box helicase [Acetobacter garciniae]MBO1324729.1 DEAD/DEAH box helicase [Acetobacter garciniae]MBX0344420.1 DEAD/DEAH box helicase [Acetobacter garciniae]